ncbi:MAG: DUF3795 domain-containing protein [Myxococcales bacterium]|nr:DUF3795 domain-containing protein [Myxococcales bacterium]
MAEILSRPAPTAHLGACGLFCTNCRRFQRGKCRGCQIQPQFAKCPVRACCAKKGLLHCAPCADFAAPRAFRECKKLNNPIARVLALLFGSDRNGALTLLRDQGLEAYLAAKRADGKQ